MGITNNQNLPERPKEKVSIFKKIAPVVQIVKNVFNQKEPFMLLAMLSVLLTGTGELLGRSFPVSWYILVGTVVAGSFFIFIRKKQDD